MNAPLVEPIGRKVARTSKVLGRAFDDALATAGGSLPTWLILLSLKGGAHAAQRALAEAVGIEGPTLTHHLNRMETEGLVTRRRDPENRRVHLVELTDAGDALFARLAQTAAAYDQSLRTGFTDAEIDLVRDLLDRLRANAEATRDEPVGKP